MKTVGLIYGKIYTIVNGGKIIEKTENTNDISYVNPWQIYDVLFKRPYE